ncbi:UNVERIFIED_CONTAM: hypothetical protein GTU68_055832 [Idotea baltica]|nr:hypothetical protein [Idotea baltica]
MSVRTRFAPSPTGFLHIGGARTALYNWLFAKKNGGQFILRAEDTDAERSTEASLDVILDGLRWLGLDWDEGPGKDGDCGPYYQSQRTEIYDAYLEKLNAAGLTYEDNGAIRFRVPDKDITVNDVICGDVTVNLKETRSNPDLVIKRPNGGYIFHFVNVVDDIEMKISHVIRGEDHLSNTVLHLALFEAFGAEPPVFAHIPLNLNENGSKMSKRDKGALIHEYIEAGFLPDAVNNYMALLGWSPKDDTEIFTPAELLDRFSMEGVNNGNSKFDYTKCVWVNAEHLKRLSPDDLKSHAAPFLEKAGISADDPRVPGALELARERAELLSEIPGVIHSIFTDDLEYEEASIEKVQSISGIDDTMAALFRALQGVDDWTVDEIKASIKESAEGRGLKMGAYMLPCRVATMGSMKGPDLVPAMVLIGKEEVLGRVENFAELI